MSANKSAISVTLDAECIRYIDAKMGKRSQYVNKLVVEDMQKHLETKKVVWIMCQVCNERKKQGQDCAYCLIDEAQTRLGGV
ncbi:MAG: hypothetical protein [Circular genetic element sp.]|nr:MAG: hypothetical protein [Circular genetic element sp.]